MENIYDLGEKTYVKHCTLSYRKNLEVIERYNVKLGTEENNNILKTFLDNCFIDS